MPKADGGSLRSSVDLGKVVIEPWQIQGARLCVAGHFADEPETVREMLEMLGLT